jgi:hypothetical protein
MSREEVERKLEELKRIYGGPSQQVLEAEVVDISKSMESDPKFKERKELESIPDLEDIETPDTPAPDEEDEDDDEA